MTTPIIRRFSLDPNSNLVVKLIEHDRNIRGGNGSRIVSNILYMHLTKSKIFEAFKKYNAKSGEKVKLDRLNAAGDGVDLTVDSVISMAVWLSYHQGVPIDDLNMNLVSIRDLWYILALSDEYKWDSGKLATWFAEWVAKHDLGAMDFEQIQKLAHPCLEFGHSRGFAQVTKRLIYGGIAHIKEVNPTQYRHLHMRRVVMQQINAARGNLRGKVNAELFKIIERFVDAKCACKALGNMAYCTGLKRTQIWPLDVHAKRKSLDEVLDGLLRFSYHAPNQTCNLCKTNFKGAILDIRARIENDCDGLCMECMEESATEGDNEYWQQAIHGTEGKYCRPPHGQSTWWFSYNGRREVMTAFKREQKSRRIRRDLYTRAEMEDYTKFWANLSHHVVQESDDDNDEWAMVLA